MTTPTPFPLRSQRSHNNIQANPISVNTYTPTSALYMALHITVYMYIALRTLQLTSACINLSALLPSLITRPFNGGGERMTKYNHTLHCSLAPSIMNTSFSLQHVHTQSTEQLPWANSETDVVNLMWVWQCNVCICTLRSPWAAQLMVLCIHTQCTPVSNVDDH